MYHEIRQHIIKVDGVMLNHSMQEKKLLTPHHSSIISLSYKRVACDNIDVPMGRVDQA